MKLYLRILSYCFGFDKWHASSPFACRPYKQDVIDLALEAQPNRVIEIGCGLGDILRRIPARRRIGVDADPKVIRASQFLYGRQIELIAADLEEAADVLPPPAGGPTLLIMVNWPHELPWEILKPGIQNVILNQCVTHILVDAIAPGLAGYPHTHGREEFSQLGHIARQKTAHDKVREIILIAIPEKD